MRAQPNERLDPRAKRLWRLQGLMTSVFLLLPAAGSFLLLNRVLDAPAVVGALPWLVWVPLAVLIGIVLPDFRWRRWRYEITEREVDLQRGLFFVTRTLVPLARVQHVDTQQGPLERWQGLSTVIFYTAAGANRIPALAAPIADEVRDRIAALTETQDEL
ncbi:MAG: PH domain-containing protein [Chloroflexota bacterium]|nr:PH domain-containing protein [Chloroflexota bacterium]